MTTVDVVMPLFDKAPYVEQAVRSVLAQTHPVRMLFVADDGSTDGGPEIVRELAAEDGRVMLLESPAQAPTGPSAARNRGIAACEAEFVAFLDADDWWETDKLAKQMARFTPGVGLVHCGSRAVDAGGRPLGETLPPPMPENAFDAVRLGTYPVTGSASGVVMRRGVLARVGGFPEHMRFGEDWDLWARAAGTAGIAAVGEPLVNIRALPTYARSLGAVEEFLLWLRVFDRWADDAAFMQKAAAEARGRIAAPQLGLFWARKPLALLWGLPRRVRREGGALGRTLYPSLPHYWAGLPRLLPHVAHPLLARLGGDAA